MFRTRTRLMFVGGLGTLALAGGGLALTAHADPIAAKPASIHSVNAAAALPAVQTPEVPGVEAPAGAPDADGPGGPNDQSGDQSGGVDAADSPGAAVEKSAPEAGGTSDGPGGHEDGPGNVDHQGGNSEK